MEIINVKDIIGKGIAMSTEDGEKLFTSLYKLLKEHKSIKVSFANIDILISHFLNEGIGKLYEKFEDWDVLDKVIEYTNIDSDDLELLKRKVIPTAKNHFKGLEGREKLDISTFHD